MPAGRPSTYTDEIADQICDRLQNGESLRQICRDESMPDRTTVYRWRGDRSEFATKYARAREAQGDYMDDLIYDEALACTTENFQVARVRIGAYQWRAAKLKPREYGERQSVELSGPEGAPLASVNLTTTDPVEASRVYQQLIGGK